jgi:dTDP-4-amino-4,6-dideoxygalactose transaminase
LEGVNRDELSSHLSGRKIPSMIYYPVPAHKQKMFSAFGGSSFDLPVTDWLTERVISLPIHTELENDQLNYITNQVLEFIKN